MIHPFTNVLFAHDAVRLPDPVEDEFVVLESQDRREDLTVQVKLTPRGEWHSKVIGGSHTRCGKPLNGYFTRDEQYGPTLADMCHDGCFSPFELANWETLHPPKSKPDKK